MATALGLIGTEPCNLLYPASAPMVVDTRRNGESSAVLLLPWEWITSSMDTREYVTWPRRSLAAARDDILARLSNFALIDRLLASVP